MQRRSGFTIIEVMLFLAISSGMAIFLLVGTGAVIQQQRYRDTVQSFATFLRGQYSRVISVENERLDGTCPISGADGGATTAVGQSNCVVVGRYVVTDNGARGSGARYQAVPVYGAQDGGGVWTYALGAVDENYELEWMGKTHLTSQLSSSPAPTSLIMYRSPDSGRLSIKLSSTLYTSDTIGSLIEAPDLVATQEVCVYDTGWMIGQRQSIFLGARAGSSDTIVTRNAQAEGCQEDA